MGGRGSSSGTGGGGNSPAGFDIRARSDGAQVFADNARIVKGVPRFKDLSSSRFREEARVIRPSEVNNQKLRGIKSGDNMLTDPRTTSVREAWNRGSKVPGIEIDVDSKGHYFVADGNHRLFAAALEGNRPILARFRPVEAKVSGMDRIRDDLSRALRQGRGR